MSRRFVAAALGAAALFVSTPALAQSTATAPAARSFKSLFQNRFGDVAAGVVGTRKTGGVINGEIGVIDVWRKIDVSVEVGWMSSVVNARRIDSAAALATFLANSQGQVATATVKVPAVYGALNARRTVYTQPRYNVYVLGGIGVGATMPKTTFRLAGSDVSASVAQYGITLGKDLSGTSSAALLNLGLGVTIPYHGWYGDVSYRLTPIFTTGQSTVANRLNAGIGRRF